jgi:hypothetical protein
MLEFVLNWLLCTVAFVTCHVPGDTPAMLRAAAAGALVAIAITVIGGHMIALAH